MLRSGRERVLQTLAYEAGGLLVALPLYQLLLGKNVEESALLLVALSITCMAWSPLHNTVFDSLEWRMAHRLASDRPHGLRFVHAVSHEGSTAFVTVPIIMLVGAYGFWEALAIDLGLTGIYAAYAYVFNLGYDRWRPVRPCHPMLTDRGAAP